MAVAKKASSALPDSWKQDGSGPAGVVIHPSFERERLKERDAGADDGTEITKEEADVLGHAILNLFEHWKLSNADACRLLGGISGKKWSRWKKKGNFGTAPRDLRTRMAHLIGIHYGLRKTYRDPAQGYDWIRMPNEAFDGRTALEVMLYGDMNDLLYIREWVNTEVGMG